MTETCTAIPEPVPVAAALSGVTVAIVVGLAWAELDELDEFEELEELVDEPWSVDDPDPALPAKAGATAETRPGVVAPDAKTIDTDSPTLTGGRLALSGTEAIRVVVVTWYGCSPDDAA